MKRVLAILGAILFLLILFLGIWIGPGLVQFFRLEVIPVDRNLTLFLGYGGNSTVLISDDRRNVLIVDTKMAGGAAKLRKFVDEHAPGAEITLVNTHAHRDHTGGNTRFPEARIIAGAFDEATWFKQTGMKRLPDIRLNPGEAYEMRVGRDSVSVRNMGRAHTLHNVVVYLHGRKLLATGDILFHRWHPALFREEGTDISSWIDTFDRLLEWDIETVVPGHGEMTDKSGLRSGKDYFVSIQQAAGDKEMLEKLKARYADYYRIPMTTSFENTLHFIQQE